MPASIIVSNPAILSGEPVDAIAALEEARVSLAATLK